MCLNSKQSHFANWQPHNSYATRQRKGQQQENDKSAFASDARLVVFSLSNEKGIIQDSKELIMNYRVAMSWRGCPL